MADTHTPEQADSTGQGKTRWFDAMFNPLGRSNKIEFTRVWTVLFFLQLFIVAIPWFIALIIGIVGGDATPVARFGLYASPVIFIVTTVASYILHTRRLRDAKKPVWLALLILVPLLLGLANFVGGVSSKAEDYAKLSEQRREYLADPVAFKAAKDAEAAEKRAENEAKRKEAMANAKERKPLPPCPGAKEGEGQGNVAGPGGQGRGGQGGGNWGGQGASPTKPLPNQLGFVLHPNLGTIQGDIIPLSALLMLWSLVYVARAPIAKRYQHQKQGFLNLYLNPNGRIGEQQFWFGLLGLVGMALGGYAVLSVLGALGAMAGPAVNGLVSLIVLLGLVVLFSVAAWMQHVLLIKRLHDAGRTGWFAPLMIPVALLCALIMGAALFFGGVLAYMHCGPPSWFIALGVFIGLSFVVALLLHFFWIAFGEPDREDNDHGPAPEWFSPEPEA